jgi:lipid A disaccharide synthetase
VGTNTAELGVLGVPMVVALPTNALEVFRGAAGGLTGLLTQLPGPLGEALTRAVNARMLATRSWLSWPNIWAREEVVPELVGELTVSALVESIRLVVLKRLAELAW